MKVKCKINCNGIGYENFCVGEERNIKNDTAKMLIEFGYAEPVIKAKKPK